MLESSFSAETNGEPGKAKELEEAREKYLIGYVVCKFNVEEDFKNGVTDSSSVNNDNECQDNPAGIH